MNYEKVILEVFSRVQELEGKVEELECEVRELKGGDEVKEENNNSGEITRSVSRNYVIDKIKENVGENIIVDKAKRALGSGIVLEDKINLRKIKIKFYHSRSYEEYPSGWHRINENEIMDKSFGLYIFNVDYKGEFYPFIFTQAELEKYVEGKSKGQSNKYHFYFHIKNNKIVEVRDEEMDVTKYYNRWDIFKDII